MWTNKNDVPQVFLKMLKVLKNKLTQTCTRGRRYEVSCYDCFLRNYLKYRRDERVINDVGITQYVFVYRDPA